MQLQHAKTAGLSLVGCLPIQHLYLLSTEYDLFSHFNHNLLKSIENVLSAYSLWAMVQLLSLILLKPGFNPEVKLV